MIRKITFLLFFLQCFKLAACEEITEPPVFPDELCPEIAQHPIEVKINFPKESVVVEPTPIHIAPELKTSSSFFSIKTFGIIATFLIASGNLLYTVLNNRSERRKKDKERAEEEIDKFWFKEILTPKVITPVTKKLWGYQSLSGTLDDLVTNIQGDTDLQLNFNVIGSVRIVEDPQKAMSKLVSVFEDLENDLIELISESENIGEVSIPDSLEGLDEVIEEEPTLDNTIPISDPRVTELLSRANSNLMEFISWYRKESFTYASSKHV